jgi:hypothetical protein
MNITHEDIQLALRISKGIQEYLRQTGQKGARSTDVYPFLARQGIVEKDRSGEKERHQHLQLRRLR